MKSEGLRKIWLIICGSLLLMIAPPCAHAKMSISTGARYDMFTDDRSPETLGYELTIPINYMYRWRQLVFTLDTGYSTATVRAGDDDDAKLSSFTDTRLSVSYGFTDLPVGFIVGIDMNLPSGKSRLNRTQRRVEVGENHDLFEVDDFGRGFNLGLNVGLAKEFGVLSVGLNGAYLFNGEFDPTQDIGNDDLDPGDQVLGLALLKWKASSRMNADAFVAYSRLSADKINGEKSLQEGDELSVGGNLQMRYRPLSILTGIQYTFQAKNKSMGLTSFGTEPKNSNGSEFFSSLEVLYEYSPRFTLRVLGDVRYYGESQRKDTVKGLPFKGQRIRYAVGPGFLYTVNRELSLNGLVKYIHMNRKEDIVFTQETTFQGVNLSIGFTYTF